MADRDLSAQRNYFILIGLQLPLIIKDIKKFPLGDLIWYGLLVSLAVIIVRIIWVYPATWIPRWLSKKIRTTEPEPTVALVGVVAWSGMRGVVSLAAALALPLTVGENNAPFPHRDMIIFLTLSVIFATLVFQGLTLPKYVKWLNLKPDGKLMKTSKMPGSGSLLQLLSISKRIIRFH